jgi:hypothetical protein
MHSLEQPTQNKMDMRFGTWKVRSLYRKALIIHYIFKCALTLPLLCLNILFGTLFSDTINLCLTTEDSDLSAREPSWNIFR